MKKLIVVIVIILLVGMSIPSSGFNVEKASISAFESSILYVGGSGPGNYTSIQAAVNDSSDGDTVFVYNGTYFENVIIHNKSITITGEDKNSTFVNSVKPLEDGTFVVIADDVTISGFTIQNGMSGICFLSSFQGKRENICISDCNIVYNSGVGLDINTYNVMNTSVSNCYISKNGYAVIIHGWGDHRNNNTRFTDCYFKEEISIDDVDNVTFENCDFYNAGLIGWEWSNYINFYNCTMDQESGSYVDIHGSYQTFDNCTFSNYTNDGIDISGHIHKGTIKTIIRNCVFSHGRGEKPKGMTLSGITNGLIEGCTFKDMYLGIYHFSRNDFIKVKNCHFENNSVGFDNFNNLCTGNQFIENNFINNGKHFNNYPRIFINRYKNNYWDDWSGRGPYRVLKTSKLSGWLNWDWRPAKEPYDI